MFGQKRKMIDALNLSVIADGVAGRHGWPPDRVKSAENEYRRFLYLLMLCPHQTLTPWSDDLDLFWHEHILHTERYAADCQHLFGRFINHDPTISKRPVGEITAKLQTIWAYHRTFMDIGLAKTTHLGTGQPLHLWPRSGPSYPLKPHALGPPAQAWAAEVAVAATGAAATVAEAAVTNTRTLTVAGARASPRQPTNSRFEP